MSSNETSWLSTCGAAGGQFAESWAIADNLPSSVPEKARCWKQKWRVLILRSKGFRGQLLGALIQSITLARAWTIVEFALGRMRRKKMVGEELGGKIFEQQTGLCGGTTDEPSAGSRSTAN